MQMSLSTHHSPRALACLGSWEGKSELCVFSFGYSTVVHPVAAKAPNTLGEVSKHVRERAGRGGVGTAGIRVPDEGQRQGYHARR